MNLDGRPGLSPARRVDLTRARRRRWGVAGAVLVVGAVLAVLLAPAFLPADSGDLVEAWRAGVGWALIALGLVLLVLAAVTAMRSGMRSANHDDQLRRFSRSQRRLASRCVRHGQRAPGEGQAVAVLIAEAMVHERGTALLQGAMLANATAVVLDASSTLRTSLAGAFALLMAILLVITLVRVRTGSRWLLTHAPSPVLQASQ